jgi:predicted enzyme related to lactoylglutathione lyase
MTSLLVNIDVEDLERASAFYCEALDLSVGRRFDGWIELLGATSPIYLLSKPPGTPISPSSAEKRDYRRHWTPVHLDFVVTDLAAALERARAAGATVERHPETQPWGTIALLADPFGNGFCLLQFTGRGYDEMAK